MACPYCESIKAKKNMIYEDEKIFAFLPDEAITKGEVILIPKEHKPIIEEVPDFIIAHMMDIANKISIVLFEILNAHGTNLIIHNGIPAGQEVAHFAMRIIPRFQNDNLNFIWQTKQMSEEEMSTIELLAKETTKGIGEFEKEKAKPIEMDTKTEEVSSSPSQKNDEENYLIRQLKRIP